MRLPLDGRSIAYDLIGPETAPTVCITHSLASDGGSWAEQVPPLLQAGFRVLRIDMRGHGGSDPVAGDYTMADLAGDVAAVLDGLAIARVHYIGLSIGGMLGQAFALAHQDKLISIMWCDTLPASPLGAKAAWDERMAIVRNANSLEPIGDATMDRWFTPAFKTKNPKRWRQIRDTIVTTTPAGYLGCSTAILGFDFNERARFRGVVVETNLRGEPFAGVSLIERTRSALPVYQSGQIHWFSVQYLVEQTVEFFVLFV